MTEFNRLRPIYTLDDAEVASQYARTNNKIVGLCHGCFDLLHIGHIHHLQEARNQVDVLFVSVSSDKACRKGAGRPAFTQRERLICAASISLIDAVISNTSLTAIPAIEAIRPELYFKGPDYSNNVNQNPNLALELESLRRIGGTLHITSSVLTASSTHLLAASALAHYG